MATKKTTSPTRIETLLGQINTTLKSIKYDVDELIEVSLHIHDAHWHGKVHHSEDLNGESGRPFIPIPTDEVSFLLSEYNNKIDKDENGLVYGLDFIIDSKDPLCPQVLRHIENTLTIAKEVPKVKMKWKDYLKTVPWK